VPFGRHRPAAGGPQQKDAVIRNKSSRRLTEQERAERRRQDRERLQFAAEQLLSSEGWRRWVRVRSHAGLARLSISNQLLVALARPDATFVAGFNTWLRLGCAVRNADCDASFRMKARARTGPSLSSSLARGF
jgi:hypothetical protein